MLGWAALVGSRDARARIARVGAGRRSVQRKAACAIGPCFAAKQPFFSEEPLNGQHHSPAQDSWIWFGCFSRSHYDPIDH
eukprot:1887473-Prymnesium_polylepis.1